MKTRTSLNSTQPSAFRSRMFSRLAKHTVFGIGSQSNTKSESSRSTVLELVPIKSNIGTNHGINTIFNSLEFPEALIQYRKIITNSVFFVERTTARISHTSK